MLLALLIASQTTKPLHVFAAASLREPLQAIARSYEQSHPGTRVELTFAGSQQLAAQIQAGAACDVFAAASLKSLSAVKLKEPPLRFALNRLAVISSGPKAVAFSRLDQVGSLVLAAQAVPAGQYARQALQLGAREFGAAWLRRVMSRVVSQEQDVRSVLAKVQLGEADAGIVYVTDAKTAVGKVMVSEIPAKYNVVAEYPVGIPSDAPDTQASRHFIHAMTSTEGQTTFESAGFLSPWKPAQGFTLTWRNQRRTWPSASSGGQVAFVAKGSGGKTVRFRGTPIRPILAGLGVKAGTAMMVGADWYRAGVSVQELGQGYIVKMDDGNFEAVIPGVKPDKWVRLLRTIEFR